MTAEPIPASRPRDSQRARVYDAENLVLGMFDRAGDFRVVQLAGSSLTLPVERRFASVASTQTYVESVLGLRWVRDRWPEAARPVTVRRRNGAGRAHYQAADADRSAVIAVPGHVGNVAWALRELVVLHEVSHHLTTDPAIAAHGPEFVGTLLELVDGVVGPEAAFALRVCLTDGGVRFR